MSLNTTPSAERLHIGIFGRRNAGKSSVINALTGQNLAIVSEVKGTTTDPVLKAMELLPLGPVVMIDTPGLDDEGELGALRIQKAYQTLNKTDIALLVLDGSETLTEADTAILRKIQEKQIPFAVVLNKSDLLPSDNSGESRDKRKKELEQALEKEGVSADCRLWVSAEKGFHIWELKERIDKCEFPDSNHVGLLNIAKRLQLIFGQIPLQIESKENVGTCVQVEIPISEATAMP